MLYVGHFTFTGPRPEIKTDPTPTGWFTLLAEAESPEAAVEKFRERVLALKGWFGSFRSVATVFLDDVTEVKALPSEGVLAHFRLHPEDPNGTIYTSLPGVSRELCVSYGWSEDPEPLEDDPDAWSERPFVDFGE